MNKFSKHCCCDRSQQIFAFPSRGLKFLGLHNIVRSQWLRSRSQPTSICIFNVLVVT
jgi:hypothetical protein